MSILHVVTGLFCESGLNELLLLFVVHAGVTHRRGSKGFTTRVMQRRHLVEAIDHTSDTVLYREPSALIDGFFLTPDHLFRFAESAEFLQQFLVWKRIELLNAHDRDVVQFLFRSGFPQIVKDLAAAQHNPLHFFALQGLCFADHQLELAVA